MNTLDAYKIDLKNMRADSQTFRYVVDDAFFKAVQGPEIESGRLTVDLSVRKTAGVFLFAFRIAGTVVVACDRCLDAMELPVETACTMKVKLGEDYSDDGEFVTIPYEDGVVDIAWNLYEFIALEVPLKHVHEPGACNNEMMGVLNEHWAVEQENAETDDTPEDAETEEQRPIDPRWNELKKILDNN